MTGPGLRRFAAARAASPPGAARPGPAAAGSRGPSAPAGPTGTCEMCGTPVGDGHGHVADLQQSTLLCACRPCYLLFTGPQAGGGRWRAVPARYLADPAQPLTAAEWDELQVPVGLAFFLRQSASGQVAGFYPSPAGVTECRLDLGHWQRLAAAHPLLRTAEPDVEAVLIHRDGPEVEHFVVPVDVCYELAGRLRLVWRGFDGGDEARGAIATFLAAARSRARPRDPAPAPGR
jgi:hypothetical protein